MKKKVLVMKKKMVTLLALIVLECCVQEEAFAFYNPQVGRWLSRDPIGGSVSVGIYLLCKNDTISDCDILGREALSDAKKWVPLKKNDPGACQYGEDLKYAADFLINASCEPTSLEVLTHTPWQPCAIKRFAWPVDCVCNKMSDSTEDQCVRGCLKYKYDTSGTFPTVYEHLDCVNQCTDSSIGVLKFLGRLRPVLEECATNANCFAGEASQRTGGIPAQYKGKCKDKKECGPPCCGQALPGYPL